MLRDSVNLSETDTLHELLSDYMKRKITQEKNAQNYKIKNIKKVTSIITSYTPGRSEVSCRNFQWIRERHWLVGELLEGEPGSDLRIVEGRGQGPLED